MAQFLTRAMMDELNAIPEPPGLSILVTEAIQPAADPSSFYDDNNLPSEAMALYDALGDASEAGDLAAVKESLANFRAELGENSHRRQENLFDPLSESNITPL
ncbi:hypothetical protein CERZMDRAFT_85979 [Cercospora zeae-maydis SCOH1-5]|uniref:Uncharacterized protein n=1 Tax=Cercospora zeae-maydis SCOH1-5 TaxID=717836 RepID=A0A6A6FBI0_9PEZI|nr:hypothetical protein CERZMDRAFT_85979 [Cercospora zeae-maydis SCOH1-5]